MAVVTAYAGRTVRDGLAAGLVAPRPSWTRLFTRRAVRAIITRFARSISGVLCVVVVRYWTPGAAVAVLTGNAEPIRYNVAQALTVHAHRAVGAFVLSGKASAVVEGTLGAGRRRRGVQAVMT